MISSSLKIYILLAISVNCELISRPIRHTIKKQVIDSVNQIDSIIDSGDDICPRAREEAAARGRVCLKKCTSDADCISTRKRCLCDGLCGWSCVRPDLNCDEVPLIENGQFKVSGNHFDARVAYTCSEGYFMSGPRERVCQGDGSWSDTPPVCRKEAVRCEKPVDPENGRANYTSTNYKSTVTYDCRYGYSLVGLVSRTCGSDKQWEGETPKCIEIECQLPGFDSGGGGGGGGLPNGYIEGRRTSVGSKIWFKCYEDMVFIGPSESAKCQEDGTWSHPLPGCYAPCLVPDIINGRINNIAPGSRVPHGTIINATCKPQYELSSTASPFLCNNGSWTHIPKCIPARCKRLPDRPKNGIVIAPKTDHGSKALYKCSDGYNLIGFNTTQCNFGKWTKATPVCHEADCKPIESTPWMEVTTVQGFHGSHSANETNPHGTLIQVSCSSKYSLNIGKNRTVKCIKGQWKPRTPVCLLTPCSIPTLDNGQYFMVNLNSSSSLPPGSKVSSGENITIICNSGYQIITTPSSPLSSSLSTASSSIPSSINISCSSGNWQVVNGTWPECYPSSCRLPEIFHGQYLSGYRAGKTVSSGSFVQYQCLSPDYSRSTHRPIRCIEGQFRPEAPACIKLSTSSPSLSSESFSKTRPEMDSFARRGEEKVADTIDEDEDARVVAIIEEDAKEEKYLDGLSDSLRSFKWCPPPQNYNSLLKFPDNQLITIVPPTTSPSPTTTTPSSSQSSKSFTSDTIDFSLSSIDSFTESFINSANETINSLFNISQSSNETLNETQGINYYEQGYLPPGSEVIFKCIPLAGPGVNKQRTFRKTSWKLICDSNSGSWLGVSLPCMDENDDNLNLDSLMNASCTFEYGITIGDHVLAFIEDTQPIHEADYPSGTVIKLRCLDIGKYSLQGSSTRKCVYGDWDGVKPVCYGLSQQHDYALEKPPTILFRHLSGPIAQSNDGHLIVHPGTILHLECLWIRKFGTPVWEVDHGHRAYPQGWTTDPARDSTLEYRLSIYHADETDSGTYTCVTPVKHRHSVTIIVKAIFCPELQLPDGIQINTNEIKMNTKVIFNCANNHLMKLNGRDQTICLPSGRWSNPVPICVHN
ncbi:uncharacterized protein LOC128386317 isoform X2 [Panonychus citri]|uniref:uncharacterized protein LOC128386317 isoform X2 n=1 Tax=Panonychus citri TaxID=50023 RepID=UPI002307B5B6|nr:uncharacterized protein LOC128386317 isoform X2 [Panonychus citri]